MPFSISFSAVLLGVSYIVCILFAALFVLSLFFFCFNLDFTFCIFYLCCESLSSTLNGKIYIFFFFFQCKRDSISLIFSTNKSFFSLCSSICLPEISLDHVYFI